MGKSGFMWKTAQSINKLLRFDNEEVEVTQDDGSIKKETKVIEPAKEHYSLRYTETLVVECAYLRREIDKLKQQIQQIFETLELHSKIFKK